MFVSSFTIKTELSHMCVSLEADQDSCSLLCTVGLIPKSMVRVDSDRSSLTNPCDLYKCAILHRNSVLAVK